MAGILAAGTLAVAQELPRRIADLSPQVESPLSPVRELADLDGTLFFAGWDVTHGEELWRSDGTPGGTTRVADLAPGAASSSPADLVAADGVLFFTAHDTETGWQLWCSDGTAAGTRRVTSEIGTGWSRPLNLTAAGDRVYFEVPRVENDNLCDVWTSDGTEEGTRPVPLTEPGTPLNTGILWMARELNGSLYFLDGDDALWGTDGTADGSGRVYPSLPDPGIWCSDLTVANGKLYFTVMNLSNGMRVWESDGTTEGTRTASWWDDSMSTEGYVLLIGTGDVLLFFVFDGAGDDRLWTSDGTLASQVLPSRRNDWLYLDAAPPVRFGKGILFAGVDAKRGVEPWFSDGTAKGTRLLKNLARSEFGSAPHGFVTTGKLAFFIANESSGGREVWVTSGNVTRKVADVRRGKAGSDPVDLTVSGKNAYWVADDGVNGNQLWCSDGSLQGTRRLTDWPGRRWGYDDSNVYSGQTLGRDGVFYFSAPGEELASALWSTDGTVEGTWQVTPPSRKGVGSSPSGLTNGGDRIFHHAWDGFGGYDLWMTDGSPEGSTVAHRVAEDSRTWWRGTVLGELGGKTIIIEQNNYIYRGLWRYEGGGQSPVPVAAGDAAPGAPGELLYFSRYDVATGLEPWVSDGTLEGTRLLKDVRPWTLYDPPGDVPSSLPLWLGTAGGKTFFSAEVIFKGRELMVTDGTPLGTVMAKDLQPSHGTTTFGDSYSWNGHLYFLATNDQHGAGLWRSDGTSEGTIQLKRFGNRNAIEAFHGLGAKVSEAGGKLCFVGSSPDEGAELWVTDGTPEGTSLVFDLLPGTRGSYPRELIAAGGQVYFSAADHRHGRELWRSDGTPGGTVMVQDLAPGWESSSPRGFAATGGKLFFQAWSPDSNTAPYVIDEP